MLRRLIGYMDDIDELLPQAGHRRVFRIARLTASNRIPKARGAATLPRHSTMASRARQSTAEPTQQRRGAKELPPYEKPAFPLNPWSQRALEDLARDKRLKDLNEQLTEAQAALGTTAGEINDRLYLKERALKKQRNQRDEDAEAQADLERNIDEFKDKVERMTQRMDEGMRKMIDAKHSVQAIRESLAGTHRDARENAHTQATLQQERTQYEDFQPTDPAAATQDLPAPIELFRAKREDATLRYQSNSLTARYAHDNQYRDFRRIVHDARHPDGDVQLPHHDDWFEDGPAPAPGTTGRVRADEDDDSDVDIAVSRAKISTTCPLTLAEFRKPLTSKLCPHSFEADAILNMIRRSGSRDPNVRGGVQVHQCPVPGCSQMLSVDDLHEDAVLVRQIRRLQAAKQREQEDAEDDDEDGEGGPTVIEDDGDDAEDVDDVVEGRSTQVKKEPRTQRGASKPPRSTARGSNNARPMEIDDDETDEDETMTG